MASILRRTCTVLFVLALALLPAAPAVAAPGTDAEPRHSDATLEEARQAVHRGLTAFARGDAQSAVAEYTRAIELVPEANIPHRLKGEALASLGRDEEAVASFRRYLEIKPDVSDRERVLARIAELLARRQGIAVVGSDPAGALVYLDEATSASCATPCELTVAPGEHRVVLRARGHVDAELRFTAHAGTRAQTFARLAAETTVAATPPPADTAPEPPLPAGKKIAFVIGGAGLVVLGASLVSDVTWVRGNIDDFDRARSEGSAGAGDALDRAQTAQTVTLTGLVAGGILLVAATVLYVAAIPTARRPTAMIAW